jgi:hypothetical protein
MENIINTFDLFGKPVTLYTKSYSRVTTCIGFTLTIISVLLFCLIFYFESYEVFKREYPNLISYKQNLNANNTTLAINNNTLNFFINVQISFDPEKLFKNFHMRSVLTIKTDSKLTEHRIKFEICNDNDKGVLSRLVEAFDFPAQGINLCPKFNFSEIETVKNLDSFSLDFEIDECDQLPYICTRDHDLYKSIRFRDHKFSSDIYFVNSLLDLKNPDKPFQFKLNKFFAKRPSSTFIKLEGFEIFTHSLFTYSQNSQFSIRNHKEKIYNNREKIIYFNISFKTKDMFIYHRSYKTLNAAFANSFALFKLITWVISVVLGPYYTYYKNMIIINKNFNYGESCLQNKVEQNKDISINTNTAELVSVNKSHKLTTCSVIKNVSCLRYFICRRRNKVRDFYGKAKLVFSKYLSIENLLLHVVEYCRLKEILLNEKTVEGLDTISRKLVLTDKLKKEELMLNILVRDRDSMSENLEK